jgi:uncharacterized Ntn-hydrolase superfamily protein
MKFSILLLLLCFKSITIFATWSVIIVDTTTGEIGIAGASCTYNCYGIGRILPGKGAIVVQAMSNKTACQKGAEMILSGASPEEIIATLKQTEFDPENQQYAVITLTHVNSPATYTGNFAHAQKGTLTGNGITIQGNTLLTENELDAMMQAILEAKKQAHKIEEILMIALEAGSKAGGDRRCGEQKATSAFLMVARSTDKTPYLNLQFFGQKPGGMNAVILLRGKYERWKRKHKQ